MGAVVRARAPGRAVVTAEGAGRSDAAVITVDTLQLSSVISVAVGWYHACGLTADGSAWCWGDNSAGQLGLGRRDTLAHRTPEPLPGALRFRTLSLGGYHTCGISLSGGLYCWGRNEHGQLGEGSVADRWQPTRVAGSGP